MDLLRTMMFDVVMDSAASSPPASGVLVTNVLLTGGANCRAFLDTEINASDLSDIQGSEAGTVGMPPNLIIYADDNTPVDAVIGPSSDTNYLDIDCSTRPDHWTADSGTAPGSVRFAGDADLANGQSGSVQTPHILSVAVVGDGSSGEVDVTFSEAPDAAFLDHGSLSFDSGSAHTQVGATAISPTTWRFAVLNGSADLVDTSTLSEYTYAGSGNTFQFESEGYMPAQSGTVT